MQDNIFREPVRVLMHLNEGYTKVLLERMQNIGLCEYPAWDIPTDKIPFHLRKIGSRFYIVLESRLLQDLSTMKVEEIENDSQTC